MEFSERIKQLAARVSELKDSIQTEEATKNAFIMPLIQFLGYDVFNPLEVIPEMTCDVGTKKGEKIDYAIVKDGEPIILIECKHWKQKLESHSGQLLRYFHVSKARFAILTNGIKYKFFTDLTEPNKLDSKPFLEIDLERLDDNSIAEVSKFQKGCFDVENIINSASGLKTIAELKDLLKKEFSDPSPEFVRYLTKQVYSGVINQPVLSQYTEKVKDSIQQLINEIIAYRLNTALNYDQKSLKTNDDEESSENSKNEVVTTEEELNGFYIVKSILRTKVSSDRITYRDALSYFAIFLDNNNRKPICRLYLNSPTNKRISFVGDDKKEIVNKIESVDDIYKFSENLFKSIEKFISEEKIDQDS